MTISDGDAEDLQEVAGSLLRADWKDWMREQVRRRRDVLTPEQLNGTACIRCGRSFINDVPESVCVGWIDDEECRTFICWPSCEPA